VNLPSSLSRLLKLTTAYASLNSTKVNSRAQKGRCYLLDQHQERKREEKKRDVKSGKRATHFNPQQKKKKKKRQRNQ
jgi:hypothetical protein